MKNLRILLINFLISVVVIISLISVSAITVEEVIRDGTGDVISQDPDTGDLTIVTYNEHITVDNLDLEDITLTVDGTSAVAALSVIGEIENRGDLSQLYPPEDATSFNIDIVTYSFTIQTSINQYMITYVNNTCQLTTGLEMDITTNITDFSVSGSILTVPFTFTSADEIYTEGNLTADVLYMRLKITDLTDLEDFTGVVMLSDTAPNSLENLQARATTLGLVGQDIQFNATLPDILTCGVPPYTWLWEFGDGQTSTFQNPTHVYNSVGNFTYSVTVTDSTGASTSDSHLITITSEDEDGGGTPGFEAILFIITFCAVWFILRKR